VKFYALPVRVGDSFFLEDKGFYALIDGGSNQKTIVELLNKRKIPNKHINILICTHYCADHINGILGVIKSKYSLDEIWLPEAFGSLSYTACRKLAGLIEHYHERIPSLDFAELQDDQDCSNELGNSNYDSFEQLDSTFSKALVNLRYFPLTCLNLNKDYLQAKMMLNLDKINNLMARSLDSGAYIRWFKYKDNFTHSYVDYGFYAENSIQTSISEYKPDYFFYVLYLTTINKQSLVFKHSCDGLPDILFTADSDLSFAKGNKLSLKAQSIVTAPHHGSAQNNSAYGKISGKSIIFVRSDRSQLKRPGSGYLNVISNGHRRYCTICRNKGPKQEIAITLNSQGSKVMNKCKKCTCDHIKPHNNCVQPTCRACFRKLSGFNITARGE
jgi:hypothetical protein